MHQGKVRVEVSLKVREMSGNFRICQGSCIV